MGDELYITTIRCFWGGFEVWN